MNDRDRPTLARYGRAILGAAIGALSACASATSPVVPMNASASSSTAADAAVSASASASASASSEAVPSSVAAPMARADAPLTGTSDAESRGMPSAPPAAATTRRVLPGPCDREPCGILAPIDSPAGETLAGATPQSGESPAPKTTASVVIVRSRGGIHNASAVVNAMTAGFRGCFLKSLKDLPVPSADVTIRMDIDTLGAPMNVSAQSRNLSPFGLRCIRARISAATFASNGTPAELELSLRLTREPDP